MLWKLVIFFDFFYVTVVLLLLSTNSASVSLTAEGFVVANSLSLSLSTSSFISPSPLLLLQQPTVFFRHRHSKFIRTNMMSPDDDGDHSNGNKNCKRKAAPKEEDSNNPASRETITNQTNKRIATTASSPSPSSILDLDLDLTRRRRPTEGSYWVTESLLAGEYPTDRSGDIEKTRAKLRKFLKCGITHFVDLTQQGERLDYKTLLEEEAQAFMTMDDDSSRSMEESISISRPVVVKRLSIPDFGTPSDPRLMNEILDFIDDAIVDNDDDNDDDNERDNDKKMKGIGDHHDTDSSHNKSFTKKRKNKNKVYVHCRGGIGRTGTTIGCYLARHGFASSSSSSSSSTSTPSQSVDRTTKTSMIEDCEALLEVNRLFQMSSRSRESYYSPETKEQMDFVRFWTTFDKNQSRTLPVTVRNDRNRKS